MDITGFTTQDLAEEGVWEQPVIMGSRMPIEIKVLGSDSDAVMRYSRQQLKKTKGATLAEMSDEDIDTLLESTTESVVVRIGGIRAIKDGQPSDEVVMLAGREIKNDKASYRYLLTKCPALKDWVLEKSNDRANFLAQRKKG